MLRSLFSTYYWRVAVVQLFSNFYFVNKNQTPASSPRVRIYSSVRFLFSGLILLRVLFLVAFTRQEMLSIERSSQILSSVQSPDASLHNLQNCLNKTLLLFKQIKIWLAIQFRLGGPYPTICHDNLFKMYPHQFSLILAKIFELLPRGFAVG